MSEAQHLPSDDEAGKRSPKVLVPTITYERVETPELMPPPQPSETKITAVIEVSEPSDGPPESDGKPAVTMMLSVWSYPAGGSRLRWELPEGVYEWQSPLDWQLLAAKTFVELNDFSCTIFASVDHEDGYASSSLQFTGLPNKPDPQHLAVIEACEAYLEENYAALQKASLDQEARNLAAEQQRVAGNERAEDVKFKFFPIRSKQAETAGE